MSDPKTPEDIEALIADFQRSGMRELHVRAGDVEIYLSSDPAAPGIDATVQAVAPAPVARAAAAPTTAAPAPAAVQSAAPASVSDVPEGAVTIVAPYLGTFYRSPKPGAPVYVDVGSVVTAESELCLVEVMKLFTGVRAGIAGTIHSILATDGQMVQADQPLFVIVPA